MLEIVLASSNPGKLAEFSYFVSGLAIKLIPQSEFGIESVEETGTTFVENALLKARHAAAVSGLPAIADDSGICVDALDGAPGVYSCRYAGPGATDEQRIEKLLGELEAVSDEDRLAHFHSLIVLVQDENDPAPLICHGVWEGEVMTAPRGTGGFGYDPVFHVPTHNCSAAELSPQEKNVISHRGQAMTELVEILKEVIE